MCSEFELSTWKLDPLQSGYWVNDEGGFCNMCMIAHYSRMDIQDFMSTPRGLCNVSLSRNPPLDSFFSGWPTFSGLRTLMHDSISEPPAVIIWLSTSSPIWIFFQCRPCPGTSFSEMAYMKFLRWQLLFGILSVNHAIYRDWLKCAPNGSRLPLAAYHPLFVFLVG